MPIYEYICPQCKTEFELRLSYDQANSTALCPNCHSDGQKLFSSFACKTGGNIQAAEKPFRKPVAEEAEKNARPAARAGSKGSKRTSKAKTNKK